MIVKMKKVAIFIQAKDAIETLKHLRSLGLLHVEYNKIPEGSEISSLKEKISIIKEAIEILSMQEFKTSDKPPELKLKIDRNLAEYIINCFKRIKYLTEYSLNLKAQISELKMWGDFKPETIEKLKEKNIFIQLYQIPYREFKKIKGDFVLQEITYSKGIVYVAVISQRGVKLNFREFVLPKLSLSEAQERLAKDSEIIKNLKEEIKKYSCLINDFKKAYDSLLKEFEFYKAFGGMGEVREVKFITGYIPIDKVNVIKNAANSYSWGILIKDPDKYDSVPTLIHYPAFVKPIKSLFKFLELIPGYNELDISPIFFIFFILFCGILISDAGVGLVFLFFTFFFHQRKIYRNVENSIFYLFYILSFSSIIFGILTGTFFGQELFKNIRPFIVGLRDNKNLQTFCFLIGTLHLTLAHFWKAIIKFPEMDFISDIGWSFILWVGFFLANSLIVGGSFPFFGKWFFIFGILLVVIGSYQHKNILKGIGFGLRELLLNLVSSFTDVVSYIRLFAVGLASVAIADAFTKMALAINLKTPIDFLLVTIIIIIGQALNIVLAPLGILVHGVRLNVLEFCNHLGIKWVGFEYKPLKE